MSHFLEYKFLLTKASDILKLHFLLYGLVVDVSKKLTDEAYVLYTKISDIRYISSVFLNSDLLTAQKIWRIECRAYWRYSRRKKALHSLGSQNIYSD